MARVRKVTLKASWVDESEPDSRPKAGQDDKGGIKCPSCEVPLRTTLEGKLFCWFCERQFDGATAVPGPDKRVGEKASPVPAKVAVGRAADEELEFEVEGGETDPMGDEGSEEGEEVEEGWEEEDDGAVAMEEVPDDAEVNMEFELDGEDIGTDAAAQSWTDDEVPGRGRVGTIDRSSANLEEEGPDDFEPDDEGEAGEGEAEFEIEEGSDDEEEILPKPTDAKAVPDGETAEDDEGSGLEFVIEEEEDEGATPMDEPSRPEKVASGRSRKRRFVPESEVEFDS